MKTQMTHPRSRGKSDRAVSDQTQGSLGLSTGGQLSVYQTLNRNGFSTESSKERERRLRGTLGTMEATSGDKWADVDQVFSDLGIAGARKLQCSYHGKPCAHAQVGPSPGY